MKQITFWLLLALVACGEATTTAPIDTACHAGVVVTTSTHAQEFHPEASAQEDNGWLLLVRMGEVVATYKPGSWTTYEARTCSKLPPPAAFEQLFERHNRKDLEQQS